MTIAEFLLARIAEDEAVAHYALSRGDGGELDYGGQWFGAVTHAQNWTPERVLVECEAKRGILDTFPDEPFGDGFSDAGGWVLSYMAAVHAGHPDYNPEWRP